MEERIIKDINNLFTQLFQKMKEAGYEWDSEKKELKKVEQESVKWGEEDERIIYNIEQFLHLVKNNPQVRNDLHKEAKDWLESLKDRYTWKPSDEQMDALDGICSYIRNKADWEISQDTIYELYSLSEQLKKLREE